MSPNPDRNLDSNLDETLETPPPMPDERDAEYLARVSTIVYERIEGRTLIPSDLINLNFHRDPRYEKPLLDALRMIKERGPEPRGKISRYKNLETLVDMMMYFRGNSNMPESFRDTPRTRQFQGIVSDDDGTPYAHALYGIGSERPEACEYLQGKVSGKVIFLFGGGDSLDDLILLEKFNPKQVVNIDHDLQEERIDKAKKDNYLSIHVRAEKPEEVKKELFSRNIGKADEIWAYFSVPYYLARPDQIEGLFQTITENLAEGGIARISPLAIQVTDQATTEAVVRMIFDQVRELMDSPDFNVYFTTGLTHETLFIERLPAESKEEQL